MGTLHNTAALRFMGYHGGSTNSDSTQPTLTPTHSNLQVIAFHVLLALLITAYAQSVSVDPGSVPHEWSEYISRLPPRERKRHVLCPETGSYKPPRSHYCSATRRLVLNMDHFCPWICNTVGFYNRKFFVQFLVYAAISLTIASVSMAVRVTECLKAHNGVYRTGTLSDQICITAKYHCQVRHVTLSCPNLISVSGSSLCSWHVIPLS